MEPEGRAAKYGDRAPVQGAAAVQRPADDARGARGVLIPMRAGGIEGWAAAAVLPARFYGRIREGA